MRKGETSEVPEEPLLGSRALWANSTHVTESVVSYKADIASVMVSQIPNLDIDAANVGSMGRSIVYLGEDWGEEKTAKSWVKKWEG